MSRSTRRHPSKSSNQISGFGTNDQIHFSTINQLQDSNPILHVHDLGIHLIEPEITPEHLERQLNPLISSISIPILTLRRMRKENILLFRILKLEV